MDASLGTTVSEKTQQQPSWRDWGHSSASFWGRLSDRKGLPATDDGEYQYEIRSVVEGHKSGRDGKRVDALTADGVSAIVVRRSRRQPFRPAPPRQQAAPRIEPY